MKLRTIIADDEPLARERVRVFVAEEPDIEVVAECAEGAAAVLAVEQHQPPFCSSMCRCRVSQDLRCWKPWTGASRLP